MEVPVKAAAALYAERVFGLLKLLERVRCGTPERDVTVDLLLVDHTSHAILAVTAVGLGAVEPDRIGVVDREGEDIGLS